MAGPGAEWLVRWNAVWAMRVPGTDAAITQPDTVLFAGHAVVAYSLALLKIATWNINNVRTRLPLLLAWLDATQPDVVALQELKCSTADFPKQALADAGYGSLCVGQRTWNGVALLARGSEPIPVRQALPDHTANGADDKQARYLEAAINGVLVACLYAPNGNPWPGPKFDDKMAWMARLLAHASTLARSKHPVLLAGDFNVVPTDADIYAPASWLGNALLQAEPRAAYATLLQQGWTDALRTLHPTERIYTFWDYRRQRWQRDAGLRIDHLLLNRSLKSRLQAAGVDRAVRGMPDTSDHAPVWVTLRD